MFWVQALARLGGLADADGKGVLYHNTCYHYSFGDAADFSGCYYNSYYVQYRGKGSSSKTENLLPKQSIWIAAAWGIHAFFSSSEKDQIKEKGYFYTIYKSNQLDYKLYTPEPKSELTLQKVTGISFYQSNETHVWKWRKLLTMSSRLYL